MGQAKNRGSFAERQAAAQKSMPDDINMFAGVADKGPEGRALLQTLVKQVPDSAGHIASFLASENEFLVFGVSDEMLQEGKALLVVCPDRPALVGAVLPSLFRDHIKGTGPFLLNVNPSLKPELQEAVDEMRFGAASARLQMQAPEGHVGVVVDIEGTEAFMVAFRFDKIDENLGLLERGMQIPSSDRIDPARHEGLRLQAEGMVRAPPAGVGAEQVRHGVGIICLWTALNHPRRGVEMRAFVSKLIREDNVAYINVSADTRHTWSISTGKEPITTLGILRRMQPGFGHVETLTDPMPDTQKMI